MKNRILEKAAEMFLQFGVKSITMDEIAGELGVSKKTLYVHYPNKKKLIHATSSYVFSTILHGIEEIQSRKLDPIEELYTIKNFAADNLKDEKSAPYYQLQKYYPDIASEVIGQQQELLEKSVRDNLQRGITEGLYRKEISLNFISKMYFLGTMGIRDQDIFPEEEFTHQSVVDMHIEYHLRAIVSEKGLKSLQQHLEHKE